MGVLSIDVAVLEVGDKYYVRNNSVRRVKVADMDGSIDAFIWNKEAESIAAGDMITLYNCYVSLRDNIMVLYAPKRNGIRIFDKSHLVVDLVNHEKVGAAKEASEPKSAVEPAEEKCLKKLFEIMDDYESISYEALTKEEDTVHKADTQSVSRLNNCNGGASKGRCNNYNYESLKSENVHEESNMMYAGFNNFQSMTSPTIAFNAGNPSNGGQGCVEGGHFRDNNYNNMYNNVTPGRGCDPNAWHYNNNIHPQGSYGMPQIPQWYAGYNNGVQYTKPEQFQYNNNEGYNTPTFGHYDQNVMKGNNSYQNRSSCGIPVIARRFANKCGFPSNIAQRYTNAGHRFAPYPGPYDRNARMFQQNAVPPFPIRK